MAYLNPNYNTRPLRHAAAFAPYSTDTGPSHGWSARKTPSRAGSSAAPPPILARAVRPQNDGQQSFPILPSMTSAMTSSAESTSQFSVGAGLSQGGQGTSTAAFDGHCTEAANNDYPLFEFLLYDHFSQYIGNDSSPQHGDHNDYSQDMAYPSAMPPLSPANTISETSSDRNAPFDDLQWSTSDQLMQSFNEDNREQFLFFPQINDPLYQMAQNFSRFPTEFDESTFYGQTGHEDMLGQHEAMGLIALQANQPHMTPKPIYRGKAFWLNSDEDLRFKKDVKDENTDNVGSTRNVVSPPTDEVETDKHKPSPGPSREIFSSESPPSSGEDELQDDTADESPSPMAIDRSSGQSNAYQKRFLAGNASPRSPTSRNGSSRYTQSKDIVGTDAIRNAGKSRRKSLAKFRCTYGNCTSEFTRRHNLNNHVKTHMGQAGTHCEKCGKELAQSSRRRHENKCGVNAKKYNPIESP